MAGFDQHIRTVTPESLTVPRSTLTVPRWSTASATTLEELLPRHRLPAVPGDQLLPRLRLACLDVGDHLVAEQAQALVVGRRVELDDQPLVSRCASMNLPRTQTRCGRSSRDPASCRGDIELAGDGGGDER